MLTRNFKPSDISQLFGHALWTYFWTEPLITFRPLGCDTYLVGKRLPFTPKKALFLRKFFQRFFLAKHPPPPKKTVGLVVWLVAENTKELLFLTKKETFLRYVCVPCSCGLSLLKRENPRLSFEGTGWHS